MPFAGVSYLAILAAAVVSWLVGAAWYRALAEPWKAALGKSDAELTDTGGRMPVAPLAVAFVAELVMAWTLAGVIGHTGAVTVGNGIITGCLVWVGFVITTMVVNHGFSRQRSALTVIDGGHWLAVLLAQGAVLGAFGT